MYRKIVTMSGDDRIHHAPHSTQPHGTTKPETPVPIAPTLGLGTVSVVVMATVRHVLTRIRSAVGAAARQPRDAVRNAEVVPGLNRPLTYNRATGVWSTRTSRGQLLQNVDRIRLIRSALAAEQGGQFRPPPTND